MCTVSCKLGTTDSKEHLELMAARGLSDGWINVALPYLERIQSSTVDRCPTFISAFKMATSKFVNAGALVGSVVRPVSC
jgi:hypothetical protein